MVIFQFFEKLWDMFLNFLFIIVFIMFKILGIFIALISPFFILIDDFITSSPDHYLSIEDIQGTWVPTQQTITDRGVNAEATIQLVFRADGTFTTSFQGPLPAALGDLFFDVCEGEAGDSDYSINGTFYMARRYATHTERGDMVKLKWVVEKEGKETKTYGSKLRAIAPENWGEWDKFMYRPKKGKDFNLFFYVGDPREYKYFTFERKKESSQEEDSGVGDGEPQQGGRKENELS